MGTASPYHRASPSAPTIRKSTPSSNNADNMSRKSGFSMGRLVGNRPRRLREWPHHGDPLFRRHLEGVLADDVREARDDPYPQVGSPRAVSILRLIRFGWHED